MTTVEIEKELRDALGALLRQRSGTEAVAALADGPDRWDPELWRELVTMGVPGLAVAEEYGGEGAGHTLAAVAQEELGRRLAPVPAVSLFAAQAALVAAAAAGSGAAATRLRDVALGEVPATVAAGRTANGWTVAEGVNAEPDGDSWLLNGRIPVVVDAPVASLFLVAAETGAGPALFAVDAGEGGAAGCEVTPVECLDTTRPLGAVAFGRCTAGLLAGPADFAAVLRAAEHAALLMLAADAVGVAAEAMNLAVDHARTRQQFGRAIGSFQAVSHRCADMLVAVESARALVAAAAEELQDPGEGTDATVCLAAAQALEAAVTVAQGCVQVHGGMGFTWEHPAHRYLRRAKAAESLVAVPDRLRERAAAGLLAAARGPEPAARA